MLLDLPASIYLSCAAAISVGAFAWLKWPRITTRFHKEGPSRDYRLWEMAMITSPHPASPPARKPRRFEIALYLSIKRCK